MKKMALAIFAVSLCLFSCKNEPKETPLTEPEITADTTAVEEPEIVEEPMDSVAMQKAWEAYMTPGEPHKMMAAEVGNWTNEMTFWMAPGAPPEKATSTAEIKMILDGHYQVANYQGEMMGMPFAGRATIAFDNASKEFISTWIDNMGTGMLVMRGTYNEATKAISSTGAMVDAITGKEVKVREVYTIVDENTRKMEMFHIGPEGDEFKSMEIVMTRK